MSLCPEARIKLLVEILGAVFATLEPHRVRGPGKQRRDVGSMVSSLVLSLQALQAWCFFFLASMEHDGILVLLGRWYPGASWYKRFQARPWKRS